MTLSKSNEIKLLNKNLNYCVEKFQHEKQKHENFAKKNNKLSLYCLILQFLSCFLSVISQSFFQIVTSSILFLAISAFTFITLKNRELKNKNNLSSFYKKRKIIINEIFNFKLKLSELSDDKQKYIKKQKAFIQNKEAEEIQKIFSNNLSRAKERISL